MSDKIDEPAPEAPVEHRGLLDRAKDEVQSWLGDPKAAGRRQRDLAAGDHSGKGPETQLDPDERIVDEISQRLTDDASLDATRISVESRGGAVTLSGEVVTSAARAHAEELAVSAPGVHQVDNRLLVA